MPQFVTRPARTPVPPARVETRPASISRPQLVQLASTLGRSPRTQALIQRHARLQNGGASQIPRSGQPVIQLKSEVKYDTQTVGYKDEKGKMRKEQVGKVADAWIDMRDPITGSAPKGQQHDMYSCLVKTYKKGFVRGHLLNDNLGGVGAVYNLFPITYSANGYHKNTAEGILKAYTRVELSEKDKQSNKRKRSTNSNDESNEVPPFVHYRVTAIPENGENLTENANAIFRCEMVAAHSIKGMGESEIWTIFSEPGMKVPAEGLHASKKDSSNDNLGPFESNGTGENSSVLTSLMRSTVNGWSGDKNFKFEFNGIDKHLDLSEQKRQALDDLDKKLEDHPIYDEFYFDALERAQTLFADVHSASDIPKTLLRIDRILQRWALERQRWRLLHALRKWLDRVALSEAIRNDMFNTAENEFNQTRNLDQLKQTSLRIGTAIGNQVRHLLQQQQPPKTNPN